MEPKVKRECDGCTKCCDGWLTGSAHGHSFWPGRPCHFVGANGCTIYEDRPHNPCKTYSCQWLVNNDIPEWLKPDRSGIIITKKIRETIPYFDVVEAGNKITVEALSWLISYCLMNNYNIKYQIGAGQYKFGTPEFMQMQF